MIKILLVCSAGMSTALLVTKMKSSAAEQGIDCHIKSICIAELKEYKDEVHVLLLAPQIRFLLNKIKDGFKTKGVPVEIIDKVDYGTMNGKKVLEQALSILNM
ncbi:MAG: PTS sugar transporter subunit IIB [Clostridium sartagoforme]|nr:PTS sugar transporter subunit IIB [Clostridium sartagoforme]